MISEPCTCAPCVQRFPSVHTQAYVKLAAQGLGQLACRYVCGHTGHLRVPARPYTGLAASTSCVCVCKPSCLFTLAHGISSDAAASFHIFHCTPCHSPLFSVTSWAPAASLVVPHNQPRRLCPAVVIAVTSQNTHAQRQPRTATLERASCVLCKDRIHNAPSCPPQFGR